MVAIIFTTVTAKLHVSSSARTRLAPKSFLGFACWFMLGAGIFCSLVSCLPPLVSLSEDGAIIPLKVVLLVLSLKTNHGPSI